MDADIHTYVIGHFANIIVNTIIYAQLHSSNWKNMVYLFSMLHN